MAFRISKNKNILNLLYKGIQKNPTIEIQTFPHILNKNANFEQNTTSILKACGKKPLKEISIPHLKRHKKSEEYHQNFKPKYQSDIQIATIPKTGTTLISQICHCIRSNGDMDYEDINDIIPWPSLAYAAKQNLDEDHKYSPRCFKRHELLSQLHGDDCRYIVTLRHPLKQIVSKYEFQISKKLFNGNPPSLNTFLQTHLVQQRSLDFHVEYWQARHCSDNLLIVHYEDMIKNMDKTIQMIANFMGFQLNDEQVRKYKYLASKEYMMKNVSKFDDSKIFTTIKEKTPNACVPTGTPKVTDGKHHQKHIFSEEDKIIYENAWKSVMVPVTGIHNYEEYAEQVTKINNQKWI